MAYNNFNYQYHVSRVAELAQKYIEEDDLDKINELLKKHDSLGAEVLYNYFNNPTPICHIAIEKERDNIALALYKANPFEVKNSMYTNKTDKYLITSDILGDAIYNKRYSLVKKFLSLEGKYKFDINGFKNTSNLHNNCYTVSLSVPSSIGYYAKKPHQHVSSPLMISIILDDLEMYNIIKEQEPYFDINNINCKFHYDNCSNEQIKDDLLNYSNL